MAALTAEQMKRGISRLDKLIKEIQEFDTQIIQKRWGPEVKALELSIEGTLASAFGHNTVEYNRYKDAAHLDRGGVIARGDWGPGPSAQEQAREAQHYANEGRERAIQLLRTARDWLQDELAATDADAGPVAGLNTAALTGLHPQIRSKCEALYASRAFAEAVEKSFKVVRDRLRTLTGYEKGSEAFGKGNLYILGAVAPHVDSDFNEGAKFLMMAIDMFRNEKKPYV